MTRKLGNMLTLIIALTVGAKLHTHFIHSVSTFVRLDRDRLLGKLLTTSPIRITFFNRSINFFLSNSSSYPALLTRYFSTNFPFVIWIQRYATQNTIRCLSLSPTSLTRRLTSDNLASFVLFLNEKTRRFRIRLHSNSINGSIIDQQ